jgi:hypothetical protein
MEEQRSQMMRDRKSKLELGVRQRRETVLMVVNNLDIN